MADRWVRRKISVKGPIDRAFPIDTLRYDNCVPASEEDAGSITQSHFRGQSHVRAIPLSGLPGLRIVWLTRFARVEGDDPVTKDTGKLHQNSLDRWKSKFGWEVIEDTLDDRESVG